MLKATDKPLTVAGIPGVFAIAIVAAGLGDMVAGTTQQPFAAPAAKAPSAGTVALSKAMAKPPVAEVEVIVIPVSVWLPAKVIFVSVMVCVTADRADVLGAVDEV